MGIIKETKLPKGELYRPEDNDQEFGKDKIELYEPWYKNRTIQAALIGAGVLLIVSIISWLISINYNKTNIINPEIKTGGNLSPLISTSGPNSPVSVNYELPESKKPSDSNNISVKTLIYENIRSRISDLEHLIIDEKISPWTSFRANEMKEVPNYHGKVIKYSGIEFEGSPRLVFWNGFIEPFLENGIAQELNSVAQECQDRNLEKTEFLLVLCKS